MPVIEESALSEENSMTEFIDRVKIYAANNGRTN
jgi:hypothetical protein